MKLDYLLRSKKNNGLVREGLGGLDLDKGTGDKWGETIHFILLKSKWLKRFAVGNKIQ
jgi:hypothetical protein